MATATLVTLASIALALDFVDGWLARRTATQVGPRREAGRRGRRVPDPRAQHRGRPVGGRLGAPDRPRALRIPRGGMGAPVAAGAAAAARLAQDGDGVAGGRAGGRGFGGSAVWVSRSCWSSRSPCSPSRSAATSGGCGGTGTTRPPARLRPGSGTRSQRPCSRCSPWRSCGSRSCSRSGRGSSRPAPSCGSRSRGSSSSCWPSGCPTAHGAFVPWVLGPLLGVLVLVKVFDLGFFLAFDRKFNPVEDWSYLSIGVETVRDTFGSTGRRSRGRRRRPYRSCSARHPRAGRGPADAGRGPSPQPLVAGTGGAHCRLGALLGVRRTGLRRRDRVDERCASRRQRGTRRASRPPRPRPLQVLVARRDRYRNSPPSRLLQGLRGKDVLLVFVESYGQMAVQGTSFSPGIDAVVNAGTEQLQADGFSSRSGWLTSPTYGGGSWLAHATLQSGVWVNSPGRYSELVASKRLTLAGAFRRAGWRTVADVPATHGSWPDGHSFYHYDKIWDRDNLGYRGPRFGFSPMPDQYALQALAEARAGEREPPSRLLRDLPLVEPRALDSHPSADLVESRWVTGRSSIACRSTGPASPTPSRATRARSSTRYAPSTRSSIATGTRTRC